MLNKSNLSSILSVLLPIAGVAVIIFLGYKVLGNFGVVNTKATLSADSEYGEAQVLVDGKEVGTTPINGLEVNSGENKVRMENDHITYEVVIDFLAKPSRTFEVALVRDLGVSEVFSAGKNLWFKEKDSSSILSVISDPDEATVYVDNNKVGTTPFSTSELTPGEYTLRVTKAGYESQSSRISIDEDYQLNVSTKLFPQPVSSTVSTLADSTNIYDVASDNSLITSDPQDWADAIIYWNQTRGIELSGVGLNKELVFDYFIDYNGNVYGEQGDQVQSADELGSVQKGAYLRRISEGPGLSDAAKQALETFEILGGKTATINFTGTGWLNVRSTPSLNGDILTKADVGNSYSVLEESNDWVKIKVSEDVQGWVSGTYVTITEQ